MQKKLTNLNIEFEIRLINLLNHRLLACFFASNADSDFQCILYHQNTKPQSKQNKKIQYKQRKKKK